MSSSGSDRANIVALEGLLVALVLLGAVYAVLATQHPTHEAGSARASLQTSVGDALVILQGLDGPRGNLLDDHLAEALHCAAGPVVPSASCTGTRPANLSVRVEQYLPDGARYALALDNGIGERELHASGSPTGERVAASYAFTPDWNATFVFADFSCYDATMDVNVTLVPVWHGSAPATTWANVTLDDEAEHAASPSPVAGLHNATIPAAGRPAESRLEANVTMPRARPAGASAYGACDLGATGKLLREALNQSALAPMGQQVPMGAEAAWAYDLRAFQTRVPGLALHGVNLTVYEPVPPLHGLADGWLVAHVVDLGPAYVGAGAWTPPTSSLYGLHPVVLRADLSVPGATGTVRLEARLVGTLTVALPGGIVPVDPPYRVVLEAWFPDWT